MLGIFDTQGIFWGKMDRRKQRRTYIPSLYKWMTEHGFGQVTKRETYFEDRAFWWSTRSCKRRYIFILCSKFSKSLTLFCFLYKCWETKMRYRIKLICFFFLIKCFLMLRTFMVCKKLNRFLSRQLRRCFPRVVPVGFS